MPSILQDQFLSTISKMNLNIPGFFSLFPFLKKMSSDNTYWHRKCVFTIPKSSLLQKLHSIYKKQPYIFQLLCNYQNGLADKNSTDLLILKQKNPFSFSLFMTISPPLYIERKNFQYENWMTSLNCSRNFGYFYL